MPGTLQIGAVLDWDKFPFEDGSSKDKLFVVLGAKQGADYLLVITTSQKHQRNFDPGCNAGDGYYFIPGGGKDFFYKDTWVLLASPLPTRTTELVAKSFSDEIRVVGNLRHDVANAIRNCLKQVDDVSQAHLDLL